jgi:hypothetical protein
VRFCFHFFDFYFGQRAGRPLYNFHCGNSLFQGIHPCHWAAEEQMAVYSLVELSPVHPTAPWKLLAEGQAMRAVVLVLVLAVSRVSAS